MTTALLAFIALTLAEHVGVLSAVGNGGAVLLGWALYLWGPAALVYVLPGFAKYTDEQLGVGLVVVATAGLTHLALHQREKAEKRAAEAAMVTRTELPLS